MTNDQRGCFALLLRSSRSFVKCMMPPRNARSMRWNASTTDLASPGHAPVLVFRVRLAITRCFSDVIGMRNCPARRSPQRAGGDFLFRRIVAEGGGNVILRREKFGERRWFPSK